MSFARTEQESGKLAAGFLRLRHGLETGPFPGLARLMPTTLGGAAGASGAAGIAAVMAGIWKADRDWKGYRSDAFTASPIAGFWAQQGERDASAIRGRTVLSQVNEQTRIERENTNAREFWRLQTKMGNRPGIFNQARWEQDWAQLSGWIGSFRSKLSNWGLDAEKAKAAGVNTLGAGGYERLGQWFNGADQLAMAFQSAASQSPIGTNEKDNIEAIRKNTEALDKLRQQQEQAKQEAWDKIRAAPMEAAFNLFGPK
jgi:hypothetical protein